MKDIKRDNCSFAYKRTLFLGVCKEEGFNNEIDVRVSNVTHGKSFDDALLGLIIVY